MNNFLLSWLNKNWLHILVWSIFIAYETIVVGLVFGVYGNFSTYVSHYMIIVSTFYFTAYKAWPWAIKDGRTVFYKAPVAIICIIIVYIPLNYVVDLILIKYESLENKSPLRFQLDYILKVLYRCIYFLGFATAYFFIRNFIDEKRKTLEFEKKNLLQAYMDERTARQLSRAENAFLKAQISPHFLFNTLDFIFHSVQPHHKEASDAIISLSRILRYAIDSTNSSDFIPLSEEIKQVELLVNIYQLRKKNALNINISVNGNMDGLYFIPLVLVTLIENMFKHGDLSNPNHPGLISIVRHSQVIEISTNNLISRNRNNTGVHAGLSNIEARLSYAYGSHAEFTYYRDEFNHFITSVKIPVSTASGSAKSDEI